MVFRTNLRGVAPLKISTGLSLSSLIFRFHPFLTLSFSVPLLLSQLLTSRPLLELFTEAHPKME